MLVLYQCICMLPQRNQNYRDFFLLFFVIPKFVSLNETNSTHGVATTLNKIYPNLFIQNHGNWPDSGETGEQI